MKQSLIILIFLVGAGILVYPHVSHWYQSGQHLEVIHHYQASVDELDSNRLASLREDAAEYNQAEEFQNIPLLDPFDEHQDDSDQAGGYYSMLNVGETMGYVSIPAIDVNLPIYHGVSEDVLTRGAGHMPNTSLPGGGEGTHTVITGHRGLPSTKMFRDLDELEKGDIFQFQILDDVLTYEVDQIKVVLPHETTHLEIELGEDRATLITCTPYGSNTHRLLVRGERIETDVPDVMPAPVAPDDRSHIPEYVWWGAAAISAAIILTAAGKLRRNRRRRDDD